MRTTFDNTGSGGWARPANPSRVRRIASWAAIFVISVLALGLGALAAVEYEAIYSLQGRGEMDPTLMTLGFVILLVAFVLGAAFGICRLVRSQAYHMMDE